MDNTKTNKKPTRFKKPSNFAEALLEVGGKPVKRPEKKESGKEVDFVKDRLKLERHKEVINTSVFDKKEEETKQKIQEIQAELKKLATEIANLGMGVDKAIKEQIANPGTYHINFFESLRTYLVQLRKKASESKSWLAISQQRKQAQNHFWGNVKKSGTKYMLSQERTAATQAG
jgi:hypothetical protein